MYITYFNENKRQVPKVLRNTAWITVRVRVYPWRVTVCAGSGTVWENPTRGIPVFNPKYSCTFSRMFLVILQAHLLNNGAPVVASFSGPKVLMTAETRGRRTLGGGTHSCTATFLMGHRDGPQLPIWRRGGFCQPWTCQAPYIRCDKCGNVLYSRIFWVSTHVCPSQSFACNRRTMLNKEFGNSKRW